MQTLVKSSLKLGFYTKPRFIFFVIPAIKIISLNNSNDNLLVHVSKDASYLFEGPNTCINKITLVLYLILSSLHQNNHTDNYLIHLSFIFNDFFIIKL